MTKQEFITQVAESAEITKKDAEKAVQSMIDIIVKTLQKGDKVSLVGFGTFLVKERSARKGRNPQTGAEIDIPASKAPGFKAGKSFKELINK